MKNYSESESAQLKFPRGAAVGLVEKVESRGLDIRHSVMNYEWILI